MIKLKKLLSLLVCASLAFVFTGCFNNNNLEVVVTLDKDNVKAGIYLGYLVEAYNKANNKKSDYKNDVIKETIDGINGADWIKKEALKSSKLAILIKREAERNSISLSDAEVDAIQKQASSQFEYFKTYYEDNGIGESSIISMLKTQKLLEKLFNRIYETGGTNPISQEELNKYEDETYVKIEYAAIATKYSDGKELSQDKRDEVENVVKKMVDSLNAGGDFNTIAKEALTEASQITNNPITTSSDTYTSTNFVNIKEYSTMFNEEFTKEIVERPVNQYGYKYSSDNFIVYKKVDKTADDYTSRKSSNLKEYKQEEYLDGILKDYENYYFEVNQKAVDYYSPSKIKEYK